MGYFLHAFVLSLFSPVRFFVIPWTVALQAPLSMGFSRQEYWSGLLCPQEIFPAQGSNPPLLWFLHCGRILYHSATWESPSFGSTTTLVLGLNNIKITCCISRSSKKQNQSDIFKKHRGFPGSLVVNTLPLQGAQV